MKKIIIRVLIALLVVIVLVVLGVAFFLDSGIKKGVETVGPMLTKVSVKVDAVGVSLLTGSGKIKGLVVGNPEGYKTPEAIKVGLASLALKPSSLMSDKIIIPSIRVEGPEITYETDLRSSNLNKILANLEEASGGQQPAEPSKPKEPAPAGPSKKLQVDDFIISGGKIHVSVTTLGGKSATVPLPTIHLTDLGKGPEGITAADLTKRVLDEVIKGSIKAASGAVTDLGKGAVDATKEAGKSATDAVKGIGDLFKKKQ